MITKAQASRMRRGYELWHITDRNTDGTPRRCYVQTYAHFTKRIPGAFTLAAKKIGLSVSKKTFAEIIHITHANTVWIRPCDWHAAVFSYALDNNRNVPFFKLKKAQLAVMRKGQRKSD